jgi:F420-dependent oxidoreductase-like protein
VVVTYTRHPVLMAQQALTANAATGGRFTLGIGPSHRPAIERLGLSYERTALHMREYLTVLQSLIQTGRAAFQGEMYRVDSALSMPWAPQCQVVVAALAPLMLKAAGELADGTVTWLAGPGALRSHIVPRISAAAASAGRPAPRVCVGLPVAVCDDAAAGRAKARNTYANYASLPNYKRLLDIEDTDVGGVAVCGTEVEVEAQLRRIAAAGAGEFHAYPFPVGDDVQASLARTRELLKALVGKV